MAKFSSIPRKKWIAFLKSLGLVEKRISGSHHIWDHPTNPLPRPVTFRMKDREIPRTHLKTNLETLGMSQKEFIERVEEL